MSRLAEILALSVAAWAWFAKSCDGKYFNWHSSIYEFQELLDSDLDLLDEIEDLVTEDKVGTHLSKTHVSVVRLLIKVHAEGIDEVYKHPVSQYRLVDAWKSVANIPKVQIDHRLEEILKIVSDIFPNELDRTAVLRNLYSIQKSHDLNAKNLADGDIDSFQGSKMSAKDCNAMGSIAIQDKSKRIAFGWFQEALKKISQGEKGAKEEKEAQEELEELGDELACEDLCKNGQEVVRNGNDLKCQMWDNFRDPWMVLQPVKMEVVETDPCVYRFHDVISDDEIDHLKMLSWAKLHDAKTQGDRDQPVKLESPRVAHHHFIDDYFKDEVVVKLNKRIQSITGLAMEQQKEGLQVATYGIGGHYIPHYDAPNVTESFDEERAATFMFYLSDIQDGGSTVFVKPGIAVRPQRGSALFWYNLLPSGYLDARTKHCACRVLVGTKWIANQWIRQKKTGTCRDLKGLGQIRS